MISQKPAACYRGCRVRAQGRGQGHQSRYRQPNRLRIAAFSHRAHSERSIHQARLVHTIQYGMCRTQTIGGNLSFTARVQSRERAPDQYLVFEPDTPTARRDMHNEDSELAKPPHNETERDRIQQAISVRSLREASRRRIGKRHRFVRSRLYDRSVRCGNTERVRFDLVYSVLVRSRGSAEGVVRRPTQLLPTSNIFCFSLYLQSITRLNFSDAGCSLLIGTQPAPGLGVVAFPSSCIVHMAQSRKSRKQSWF